MVLIAGKVFDEMPKRGKHLPGRSALRYGSMLVRDRGSEGGFCIRIRGVLNT